MKYCSNCGAKMEDEALSCMYCGMSFSNTQLPGLAVETGPQMPAAGVQAAGQTAVSETVPVQKKKKVSRKKVVAILCLALFLLGLGIGGYFFAQWFFSPEQTVLRYLKDGKYDDALELVEEERLSRSNNFEDALMNRLDEIKECFTKGSFEYAAVSAEMDAIEKMNMESVSSKLPELRDYVEELNSSRTCFATAEKFYEDGSYGDALELYRQVIKSDGNYDKAKSRITECTEKYRAAVLEEAAKYAEGSSFSNAVAVLEAALEVLPGDADITSQKLLYEKDNVNQLKEEALDEAAAYAANKDYESAMSVLDKYAAEYGNASDVSVKYNEYQESYVDSVLTEVDKYQTQGDYPTALKTLNAGLDVAKDNTRLKNRQQAVSKAYAEKVCADADALVAKKKYDDAITAVEQALTVVPGNTTLTEKRNEIENKMPKCFVDVCKPYESDGYEEFTNQRTFCMAGKEYTNGFKMEDDGYALWNVDGKYNKLEFDLGHIDGTYMEDVTVEISIDGNLYKTIKVSKEKLPQHYEINLTGVKQIRIKTSYHVWDPYIGMANMVVQ